MMEQLGEDKLESGGSFSKASSITTALVMFSCIPLNPPSEDEPSPDSEKITSQAETEGRLDP